MSKETQNKWWKIAVLNPRVHTATTTVYSNGSSTYKRVKMAIVIFLIDWWF